MHHHLRGNPELDWGGSDGESWFRCLLALRATWQAELGRRVIEMKVSPGGVDRPAYYGWMVSGDA